MAAIFYLFLASLSMHTFQVLMTSTNVAQIIDELILCQRFDYI